MGLDVKATVRPLPLFTKSGKGRVAFERIARDILGPRYELSLVICGEKLATRMNIKHRGKDYSPNVLSFPLSKTEGEIFLNMKVAAREAHRFNVSIKERVVLLFAHGCLHLKGLRHGTKMETLEARIAKKYGR